MYKTLKGLNVLFKDGCFNLLSSVYTQILTRIWLTWFITVGSQEDLSKITSLEK